MAKRNEVDFGNLKCTSNLYIAQTQPDYWKDLQLVSSVCDILGDVLSPNMLRNFITRAKGEKRVHRTTEGLQGRVYIDFINVRRLTAEANLQISFSQK